MLGFAENPRRGGVQRTNPVIRGAGNKTLTVECVFLLLNGVAETGSSNVRSTIRSGNLTISDTGGDDNRPPKSGSRNAN
jgi:hypothetical protein